VWVVALFGGFFVVLIVGGTCFFWCVFAVGVSWWCASCGSGFFVSWGHQVLWLLFYVWLDAVFAFCSFLLGWRFLWWMWDLMCVFLNSFFKRRLSFCVF